MMCKNKYTIYLLLTLIIPYSTYWICIRNFSVISVSNVKLRDGVISARLQLQFKRDNAKLFCQSVKSESIKQDTDHNWHTNGYAIQEGISNEWIYSFNKSQKIEIIADELPNDINSLSCHIRQADYNFLTPP